MIRGIKRLLELSPSPRLEHGRSMILLYSHEDTSFERLWQEAGVASGVELGLR
jgi:hypothetical protein